MTMFDVHLSKQFSAYGKVSPQSYYKRVEMISAKNHPKNGSRTKESVLIVDDNPDNLRLLSRILTKKGYKVRPAPGGSLALKSVHSALPDLILLDIKMPGMDGYEVCRRLKADEKTRDIPVLFISGLTEVTDKIKGFSAGGADYITKPFQYEEVLARVETHVSLARMHKKLAEQNIKLQQEIMERKGAQEALKKTYDELKGRLKERIFELTAAIEQLKHEMKDRKHAKESLPESAERFPELADSLPQFVFETDEKGTLTFANQNGLDIFGYNKSDINKGYNLLEMVIPEDRDRALKNFELRFKGEIIGGAEYTALRKNGDTLPVLVHANVFERDNRPAGIRGIIIDLTEHVKMESDIKHRAIAMDQTSDTILITDTEGTITYVNPAFEKTTGYTSKEALGENTRILKSGKQDKAFYRYLWQTISGGKTWSGRFINKKKDGSHYTEEATISPVFSGSGKIVNYVAVKRDITDKIDLEIRLSQARKMEAIGTLAGGIAHDFNNILGAIISYTDLALLKADDKEKVQLHLENIIQTTLSAKDLTRQILTFGQPSGKEQVPVSLVPIVKDVLKLLRATLPPTIRINEDLKAEKDVILADSVQIHQVLMNLCTNAKHAMRVKGGVLEVGLRNVESGMRNVDLKNDKKQFAIEHPDLTPGSYLQLTVSDTGDGIPDDVIDRVFDPYFTTKAKGEGTGLGLSVVHGIVKDHGGGIHLTSEEGKGATFQIVFPALS